MKSILFQSFRFVALASSLALGTQIADAGTLIAYPTVDEPIFTIIVPDDWELEAAEEEQDFFLVASPSGSIEMYFRAMEIASEDDAVAAYDEAIEGGVEWLDEHYDDVEFGEVTEGEHEGMHYVSIPGTGVFTESGEEVVFTIAFIFLENGTLAEFWGIIPAGDQDALATAQAVLDTFEGKIADAGTLIAYPTVDEPIFTIIVPDDWELEAAEEEQDFFLVASPSGSIEMYFRAMEIASEDDAVAAYDEAIEGGVEWLDEHYDDVEFGEVTEGEHEGMHYVSIPGTGVFTESGEEVVFTIAFIFLENGTLAEFWGIIPAGDQDALATAQAVLDTFEGK